MATPNSIITPQVPVCSFCDLTGGSASTGSVAIVTRATLTATTNISAFKINNAAMVNTNGTQINSIIVRGAATGITAATQNMLVFIYEYDGGGSYWLVDEIVISAVTPSITTPAFITKIEYNDWLLAPAHTLWAGVTVATAVATTALSAQMNGGAL